MTSAATLTPLDTLYDANEGHELPLPPDIVYLYGRLGFPPRSRRPHVIANVVTTLDGVVALGVPGHEGGGDISAFNTHDRLVMGLLRAVADAVIVGAGTLCADPAHLWTAAHIYPPLADAYRTLRTALGKPDPPLTVIVTARGAFPLDLPVFQSGAVPVLIVTTADGAERLRAQGLPPSVRVADIQLLGDVVAERRLDELFLTVAPQIAGRADTGERPGLVAGHIFAPADPRWGTLVGVKRAGSHLFLRFALAAAADAPVEDG